jgi:hypothetical protein
MRIGWQQLRQLNKGLQRLVILACTIALITAVAQLYQSYSSSKLQANPVKGTAIEVSKLLDLTIQLDRTIHDMRSSQSTRQYVRDLNNIEKTCQRINKYTSTKPTTKLLEDDESRFNQSQELCQDLSQLSKESKKIYLTIEKLLMANAKPRRYQTFPPIGLPTPSTS